MHSKTEFLYSYLQASYNSILSIVTDKLSKSFIQVQTTHIKVIAKAHRTPWIPGWRHQPFLDGTRRACLSPRTSSRFFLDAMFSIIGHQNFFGNTSMTTTVQDCLKISKNFMKGPVSVLGGQHTAVSLRYHDVIGLA